MTVANTPVTSTTEQQLQAAGDRIRALSRNTSVAAIETGRLLLEAKGLVPHGSFAKWVQNTCGFTLRTAQIYMRVAILAEGKSEATSLLTLRALYLLSAKRAPDKIVTWVFREIDAGRVPTEHEIESALRCPRAPARINLAAGVDTAAQFARALARELIERVGHSFARALIDGEWARIGEQLDEQLRLAGIPEHHDGPSLQLAHDSKLDLYRPEMRASDGPIESGAGDHPVTDSCSLTPEGPPTSPAAPAALPAPGVPQPHDGIPEFLRRAPSATHH